MRFKSLTVLVGVLILAVLLPADSAAGVEVIKDGSFEGAPSTEENPNWTEGWLVFSPICDPTDCGTGGGTTGPRTGQNWVWFGGSPGPEDQFVSQEVLIPRGGVATLTFYLWLGVSSGNGIDVFRVTMDGTELLAVPEDAGGYGSYTLVTIDVGKYVSDRPHELRFEFQGAGGGVTNFSLDDVSLQAGAPAVKKVTLTGPKKVAAGKKAKLTAKVEPCAGHEGDTIELFRGKKKIAGAASDQTCSALFKVRVKKTRSYQAVSPQQDADHLAGTSNKLKVKVKRKAR